MCTMAAAETPSAAPSSTIRAPPAPPSSAGCHTSRTVPLGSRPASARALRTCARARAYARMCVNTHVCARMCVSACRRACVLSHARARAHVRRRAHANLCGAEQHRRVRVVAARVHAPWVRAGEGHVGLLVHRQAVKIRAKQHDGLALAHLRHDTRDRHGEGVSHAERVELAPHDGASVVLLVHHGRHAMELAAKCDDVIRHGEGLGGHSSVGGGNFRRADGTVGGKRDATSAHTQARVRVRARSDRGREPRQRRRQRRQRRPRHRHCHGRSRQPAAARARVVAHRVAHAAVPRVTRARARPRVCVRVRARARVCVRLLCVRVPLARARARELAAGASMALAAAGALQARRLVCFVGGCVLLSSLAGFRSGLNASARTRALTRAGAAHTHAHTARRGTARAPQVQRAAPGGSVRWHGRVR